MCYTVVQRLVGTDLLAMAKILRSKKNAEPTYRPCHLPPWRPSTGIVLMRPKGLPEAVNVDYLLKSLSFRLVQVSTHLGSCNFNNRSAVAKHGVDVLDCVGSLVNQRLKKNRSDCQTGKNQYTRTCRMCNKSELIGLIYQNTQRRHTKKHCCFTT